MIRPRGIGLVLVAIIVFLLAGAMRIGWLFVFDSVLWGTLAVSAIAPWLATGKLQVRRRVVGWEGSDGGLGPMEGDAVEFEIRLHNRGLLPCMFVTVRYNCGGQPVDPHRDRVFVAWLGRGRSLSATTAVRFQRRGPHVLPGVEVETTVPFGLFRRSQTIGQPTQLVVLPRVYPLRRLSTLGKTGATADRPLPARVGEQTVGSRNYVPMDPWQHIHWRNTARVATLQVKEFEKTPDDSLVIAFDTRTAQKEGDESLEHAVRIAASVGDFVCRAGGTVWLLAGRLDEETSSRYQLLEKLALLESVGEATLSRLLLESLPATDVLAIVRDTEGVEAILRMAGTRHRVTAVVLRGFEDSAPLRDPSGELNRAGVATVECWPGDIPGAMAALESLGE